MLFPALLLHATLAHAAEPCTDGRLVTPDSLGHCCWEGQAWNGSECVGTPTCPEGLNASGETCSSEAPTEGQISGLIGTRKYGTGSVPAAGEVCPEGEVFAADGAHCCYPGQGWSSARSECVGSPRAIGGLVASGDGPASPVILGALDKKLIDRVIKDNKGKIRRCYQRGLDGNPALAGKVVVKFVIAKDGTVSKAETKSSTLNSPTVEQCINQEFMRFKFPKPSGGGIVIVSYPFVFSL